MFFTSLIKSYHIFLCSFDRILEDSKFLSVKNYHRKVLFPHFYLKIQNTIANNEKKVNNFINLLSCEYILSIRISLINNKCLKLKQSNLFLENFLLFLNYNNKLTWKTKISIKDMINIVLINKKNTINMLLLSYFNSLTLYFQIVNKF